MRHLETLGMEVTPASDGFEALRAIERAASAGAPYAVVFLDQIMPAIDGPGWPGASGRCPAWRRRSFW